MGPTGRLGYDWHCRRPYLRPLEFPTRILSSIQVWKELGEAVSNAKALIARSLKTSLDRVPLGDGYGVEPQPLLVLNAKPLLRIF